MILMRILSNSYSLVVNIKRRFCSRKLKLLKCVFLSRLTSCSYACLSVCLVRVTVLDCKLCKQQSHLSVCLLICLCLGTSCACVSVWTELNGSFRLFFMKEGCAGTSNLVMQLMLYPLAHSKQSGQMAGPQEGPGAFGFALRPWESLWLTSPAQGADVTGLNGKKRSEKLKLTRAVVCLHIVEKYLMLLWTFNIIFIFLSM